MPENHGGQVDRSHLIIVVISIDSEGYHVVQTQMDFKDRLWSTSSYFI